MEIDFGFDATEPSDSSGNYTSSTSSKTASEKSQKKKSDKKKSTGSPSSDSPIHFDIPSIAPFC